MAVLVASKKKPKQILKNFLIYIQNGAVIEALLLILILPTFSPNPNAWLYNNFERCYRIGELRLFLICTLLPVLSKILLQYPRYILFF